jgi:hypothetical protein
MLKKRQTQTATYTTTYDSMSWGPKMPHEIEMSSLGTLPEAPIPAAQPVIGRDTLAMSDASEAKLEPKEYPLFIVNGVTCCGIMDVSGIQQHIEQDVSDIILGLHDSILKQSKCWLGIERDFQKTDAWVVDGKLNGNRYNADLRHNTFRGKIRLAGAYLFTYTSNFAKHNFDKRLSEFVAKHGLGTVTVLPAFLNPNSHNDVITVLWGIERKGYDEFIAVNYVAPVSLAPEVPR